MTRQLTLDYNDELLVSLGLSEQEFRVEAGFLLAAKLYELGKLSSGQAARLCGLSRVAFLLGLPRAGVTVSNLRPEDADADIAFGRDA